MVLAVGCGVPVDLGGVDTSGGGSTSASTSDDPVTSMEASSVGDGTSTSGNSSMSSTGTGIGETEAPIGEQRDIAQRYSDLPDVGSGGESSGNQSSGSEGTGGSTDPNALVITATTGPASCGEPDPVSPCPNAWTYRFVLPPELQMVGGNGELGDVGGTFTQSEGVDGECGFGGGTVEGRFEITFIDDTRVVGRMFELQAIIGASEVAFDAPICGT